MAPRTCQKLIVILSAFFWFLVHPTVSMALEPDEVMVIANTRANDSLNLAEYYMLQRHIPTDHLVKISTSLQEHCSRESYDREIRNPIREALAKLGSESRIRCLVTMYGVPLAIEPLRPEDDVQLLQLKQRLQVLNKEQDSELALVQAGDYPLDGWLPNPYFLGFGEQQTLLKRDTVLMVSRLDGPDPATVRRLVDDALYAEKKGLQGRAYFDARWPKPAEKKLEGYALYDASLHTAAEGMRTSGRMEEVKLDERDALFQKGDCPQAALYCGWYSLGHYVDAFAWVRGAIGYHIASSECATLKQKDSQVWCKRLLEEGVAATIGPVYEPYVQAFPLPDLFFLNLTEGYLSLAESYLVSLPYLSWQMVLIGDPLYKPFAPQ
jgi:uncharacterized protein (TIGR03790 family)